MIPINHPKIPIPQNSRLLTCGGAGTVVVDSGLPRVGQLYRVDLDGYLRWYLYRGGGYSSPDASFGWEENSGNAIGHGWDKFKFLCGAGDGHLFAVEQNGDLRWYGYNAGDGVEDPGATRGWDPNSGNIIGNGFGNFTRVVCSPRAGNITNFPSLHSTLYCIEPNGDLRWYSYSGDGAADHTGATGWAPNSGNIIGHGWNNFKTVFTSGSYLFGVEPNGDLRWYWHDGDGREVWVENSGNVVGRGWHHFSHITGEPNGTGHTIYAVKPDGALLWYEYNGVGEQDPSGHLIGWHERSGNQIGHGW